MKKTLLYKPMSASEDKYQRLYYRLLQLTGSRDQIKRVLVNTDDNMLLDTIYIENKDTNKCILFFHGNSGNLSMRFDMIKFLYNYASVIIFDYRAFGKSSGNSFDLNSINLYKDADAIWSFATVNLRIKPNNLSLMGESLGCAIAIHLASKLSMKMDEKYYPHSLILNSPFYSLSSIIEILFSRINLGFVGKLIATIMGNEYQSCKYIKFINHVTKIVIAHSPRDEVIPYSEGLNLYNTISHVHPYSVFVNILGTHNNLCLTDKYIYTLADIFDDN